MKYFLSDILLLSSLARAKKEKENNKKMENTKYYKPNTYPVTTTGAAGEFW